MQNLRYDFPAIPLGFRCLWFSGWVSGLNPQVRVKHYEQGSENGQPRVQNQSARFLWIWIRQGQMSFRGHNSIQVAPCVPSLFVGFREIKQHKQQIMSQAPPHSSKQIFCMTCSLYFQALATSNKRYPVLVVKPLVTRLSYLQILPWISPI